MTDPIKNAFIWLLSIACVVLGAAAWLGHARLEIAQGKADLAISQLKKLGADVVKQKAEAAAELRTANASVLAQQKRLDAAAATQKVTDEKAAAVVDSLRTDLRAARLRAGALEAAARRGGSGAAEQGGDPAGAGAGAGSGASAGGVLPDPEAEADDDAYAADRINIAYAACRADAIGLRAILNRSPAPSP